MWSRGKTLHHGTVLAATRIREGQYDMARKGHQADKRHHIGHNAGDTAWTWRYTSARDLLDETDELLSLDAAIEHLAEGRAMGRAPTATILSPDTLTGARRVGVVAGSFNPLTLAHLALVESARGVAELDLVIWLHAIVTVDKERVQPALLADRLAQLLAYARNVPGNVVALCSHGLYVDIATALSKWLAPETEVCLLVGFDKIVQILDPRYYTDRAAALATLFDEQRVTLLVGPRADADAADLAHLLAQPEHARYANNVKPVPLAAQYAADSSTEVRHLAAAPEVNAARLRALVPPEALALILETGAYRTAEEYALREQWLTALSDQLGRRSGGQRRGTHVRARDSYGGDMLPSISRVVKATTAANGDAAAVRAWLALPPEERETTPVREMLARLGLRV